MNDTGFDKAHLSRYLDILRSLGFVEKEVPVTGKSPDKSRLGLYRLHDRFFAFWFKYVLPNRGRLEPQRFFTPDARRGEAGAGGPYRGRERSPVTWTG